MENQEKQQELRKEFEEKTGQKWFTNPVCHGETGYASWDYQLSLEDEVIRLREELTKLKEVKDGKAAKDTAEKN